MSSIKKSKSQKPVQVFTCSKCNKKFPSEYKLNRHLNRKFPCTNYNSTKCQYCGNFFYDSSTRKRHEQLSCNENPNILVEPQVDKS